ncbi:MAG: hypothetical protein ACTSVW_02565 [Candidatus Njordarchaeales archaeon]
MTLIHDKDIEHIFRAYDIRGIVGENLFPDVISKASAIFANIIEEYGGKNIAVSGDGRISTPMLINSISAGVTGAGLDVFLLNTLPITMFYYSLWANKEFDGGAYVTASHNPPQWNGVRFRKSDGTGFSKENTEVKKRFFSGKIKWAEWNNIGRIIHLDESKIIQDYINFVMEKAPPQERQLEIILDTKNGIAGKVAPYLLSAGNRVMTLNANIDGTFPSGSPDPVDGDISKTIAVVKENKNAIGMVFDGDGDRVVILDERGRRVPPEIVGIFLAKELLKSGDIVVYNAECASIIRNKLEEMGIKAVETRVGDVFVAESAKKNNAKLGIEGSYHIFLPLYGFYYDDAIFAAYLFSVLVANKRKKVSEIYDEIGHFYVKRENFDVPDKIKWIVVSKLAELYEKKYETSTIDGVKIYLQHGSVLIRPSNTEPVIRMMTEADDEEELIKLHKKFKAELLNVISDIKAGS